MNKKVSHSGSGEHAPEFRFALYGMKGSGKTCILAALAMSRDNHPREFTCTRVLTFPAWPRPEGDHELWEMDLKDKASAFHTGQYYLDMSIEALESGNLPEPTPNFSDPLIYLFKFTAPGQRSYLVEILDYSGELIDPSVSEEEIAKNLRKHLNESDGLLILAEAPFPETDTKPLAKSLQQLQEAFTILENDRGNNRFPPLVLLLNKWDRRSRIEYEHWEMEAQELDVFLAGKDEESRKLPYGGLAHLLRNCAEGDFHAFPVSAFGDYRLAPGGKKELPARVNPLPSFGLIDPFVWLGMRCDENKIVALEEKKSKTNWNRFWKIRHAVHVAKESRQLKKKFPQKSYEQKRVKAVQRTIRTIMLAHAVIIAAIAYGIYLMARGAVDLYQWREVNTVYSDPEGTSDEIEEADAWLAAYGKSPLFTRVLSRHFHSSEEAFELLTKKQDERDKEMWARVEAVTDPNEKEELARIYLKQYGDNGAHREEARAIIITRDLSIRQDKNREYLRTAKTKLATFNNSSLIEDVEALRTELSSWPYPENLTDELVAEKNIVSEEISDKILEISAEQQRKELAREEAERERRLAEFRVAYNERLSAGKIVEAANQLASWTEKPEEIETLRAEFREKAMKALKTAVETEMSRRLYERARQLLVSIDNDPVAIEMLGRENINTIQKMQGAIDSTEDRILYEEFRKYKNADHGRKYLEEAKLGCMKNEVQHYLNYLKTGNEEINLTLVFSAITWDVNVKNNYDTSVCLTVDGHVKLNTTVKCKPNGRTDKLGESSIIKKLTDPVKLHVKAVRADGYLTWGDAVYGDNSLEKIVKDFKDGVVLKLEGQGGITNYATFHVHGFPEEPGLPEWKETQ